MTVQGLPSLSRQPAFRSFYVPHFEVRIAGEVVPEAVIADVMQLTYKDNVREIDSVDLTVNNWDSGGRARQDAASRAGAQRFKYIGSETKDDLPGGRHPDRFATLFEPGRARVEVWLGYVGQLRLVSTVNFTSLEPSFPSGGAPSLQVRGLNVLHSLRDTQHSSSWVGQKPSAIAEQLAKLTDKGKKRIPWPLEIDRNAMKREVAIDYIAQDNQHDVDFLLNLARRVGYELIVVEPSQKAPRHLYFGPSKTAVRPADYELVWGETLMDFKPRLATAQQIAKVTVQGWDRRRKRPIKVTVDLNDAEVRRLNPDLQRLVKEAGGSETKIVEEPVFTEQEARQRARAILLDNLRQMVTAEGTTVGLPDLRAGSRLMIAGVGARLSGEYFVLETTHSFGDSGYITRFKARREDERGRP